MFLIGPGPRMASPVQFLVGYTAHNIAPVCTTVLLGQVCRESRGVDQPTFMQSINWDWGSQFDLTSGRLAWAVL
jgi:hypothetical protein